MEKAVMQKRSSSPRRGLLAGLKMGFRKFTVYHERNGDLNIKEIRDISYWKQALKLLRAR